MIEPQPPSPSNETAAEQDAWSPQAAVAAKDFKYGAGSPVSVEILNDNGRRRTWSAVAVILLLSATSLAQAILASAVRRREIRVESSYSTQGHHPTAGNPAIGLLGLGVAACFVVLSVLDKRDSGICWVKGVKTLAPMYSIIALGIMTIWSFGERGVYVELRGYEQCMNALDSDNIERRKCVCWNDEADGIGVYISLDTDISCTGLLEYAGNIMASYVLMVIVLVLTVAGLWSKPYKSKPVTTDIVLEATPTPYVVTRTSPVTNWGKYPTG